MPRSKQPRALDIQALLAVLTNTKVYLTLYAAKPPEREVSELASLALDGIALIKTRSEIPLVTVSGEALGFTGIASQEEIDQRAFAEGCALVPQETGFQLLLKIDPEKLRSFPQLRFAAPPVRLNGRLWGFSLHQAAKNPRLEVAFGDRKEAFWRPSEIWVYQRRGD